MFTEEQLRACVLDGGTRQVVRLDRGGARRAEELTEEDVLPCCPRSATLSSWTSRAATADGRDRQRDRRRCPNLKNLDVRCVPRARARSRTPDAFGSRARAAFRPRSCVRGCTQASPCSLRSRLARSCAGTTGRACSPTSRCGRASSTAARGSSRPDRSRTTERLHRGGERRAEGADGPCPRAVRARRRRRLRPRVLRAADGRDRKEIVRRCPNLKNLDVQCVGRARARPRTPDASGSRARAASGPVRVSGVHAGDERVEIARDPDTDARSRCVLDGGTRFVAARRARVQRTSGRSCARTCCPRATPSSSSTSRAASC